MIVMTFRGVWQLRPCIPVLKLMGQPWTFTKYTFKLQRHGHSAEWTPPILQLGIINSQSTASLLIVLKLEVNKCQHKALSSLEILSHGSAKASLLVSCLCFTQLVSNFLFLYTSHTNAPSALCWGLGLERGKSTKCSPWVRCVPSMAIDIILCIFLNNFMLDNTAICILQMRHPRSREVSSLSRAILPVS